MTMKRIPTIAKAQKSPEQSSPLSLLLFDSPGLLSLRVAIFFKFDNFWRIAASLGPALEPDIKSKIQIGTLEGNIYF